MISVWEQALRWDTEVVLAHFGIKCLIFFFVSFLSSAGLHQKKEIQTKRVSRQGECCCHLTEFFFFHWKNWFVLKKDLVLEAELLLTEFYIKMQRIVTNC